MILRERVQALLDEYEKQWAVNVMRALPEYKITLSDVISDLTQVLEADKEETDA